MDFRKIEVYNLSGLPVEDFSAFQELQGDFKKTDKVALEKLKQRIIETGFKYAFQVWKDPEGVLWIIDAHHRKKALQMLRDDGWEVPPVPYVMVHATDRREAIKEIAFVNSQYSKINPDTTLFRDNDIFMEELDFAEIKLNWDEQPAVEMNIEGDESGNVKNLNRLSFAGNSVFMTDEETAQLVGIYKAYVEQEGNSYGFVTYLLNREDNVRQ